jgi:hypothetical protein
MPPGATYLWNWFWEILEGVPPNGMAVTAIGWRDLTSWRELTGETLQHWEARLLVRLGVLRADILSEPAPKPPGAS